MVSRLIRMRWPIPVAVLVLLVAVVAVAVAREPGRRPDPRRLQRAFALRKRRGLRGLRAGDRHRRRLHGGTAPSCSSVSGRRAGHSGRRADHDRPGQPVAGRRGRPPRRGSPAPRLEANVPAELHDDGGSWWALTTRLRVPVVSTARVEPGSVTGYEALGDPQFAGHTCLRTSANEYNQSLVADMLAKRGQGGDRGPPPLVDGERGRRS